MAIEPQPISQEREVLAIRAMIAGKATQEQQILGMEWIMREAARVPDVSFRPGDPHYTAFNEGRRYVGVLIRYMLLPETLIAAQQHDRSRLQARQS
jgi:hypothetical protein